MFCVQSFNCLAFMLSRPLKEPPQIIEPEVKPSTPSKEKRKSASKTKEPQREVRHECDLKAEHCEIKGGNQGKSEIHVQQEEGNPLALKPYTDIFEMIPSIKDYELLINSLDFIASLSYM